MKKILVTSAGFAGYIMLVYGMEDDVTGRRALMKIELQDAVINDVQRDYVLSKVPRIYDGNFATSWGAGKLQFIESELEVDFNEDFYWPYGKAVNPDRVKKEWAKTSAVNKVLACWRLKAYLRYLARIGWRSKADPETYLKKKMYLNDWDNVYE